MALSFTSGLITLSMAATQHIPCQAGALTALQISIAKGRCREVRSNSGCGSM